MWVQSLPKRTPLYTSPVQVSSPKFPGNSGGLPGVPPVTPGDHWQISRAPPGQPRCIQFATVPSARPPGAARRAPGVQISVFSPHNRPNRLLEHQLGRKMGPMERPGAAAHATRCAMRAILTRRGPHGLRPGRRPAFRVYWSIHIAKLAFCVYSSIHVSVSSRIHLDSLSHLALECRLTSDGATKWQRNQVPSLDSTIQP